MSTQLGAMRAAIVNFVQSKTGLVTVNANQSLPEVPDYPFISFTITTLIVANNGTWGRYSDGTSRKEFEQVWSFTVQSDDEFETVDNVLKLLEIFDRPAPDLEAAGIFTVSCTNVTNRDNILTSKYEYRQGFDVVFRFLLVGNGTLVPDPLMVEVEIELGGNENG